jgi:hypothetical protein
VVFSRLKLHFMSQMSKWLTLSLGMNIILDNVLVPTSCFYLFPPLLNHFSLFTAGNHVRLDISIWKMGPKSGMLEE